MNLSRRKYNPGKREREARKRRRRGGAWLWGAAAGHGLLKLGPKHLGRNLRRLLDVKPGLAVADAENSAKGPEESVRQVHSAP